MMVRALLLLPRLTATPPLAVEPTHHADIRRLTACCVQLGEDGGKTGHIRLQAALSNAHTRGSTHMRTDTCDSSREVVLAAVQQHGLAEDATAEPQEDVDADREVVLSAVLQYGLALRCASDELKAVVLAAVQRSGCALKYASAELKVDREVVLAAVRQNGHALEHASAQLQADREVVVAAAQHDLRALRYASAELQKNHVANGTQFGTRTTKTRGALAK